jgi:hypothetical protein
MTGIIATQTQAKILFYLSWLGLLSGSVGTFNGKPALGLGVCVGSFLAQNYWRDPQYDWRRLVDMAWLQVLIWSHLWYVCQSPIMVPYLGIQTMGVLCYAVSWHHLKQNNMWRATLCHAGVHLCANGSLLLFYIAG